MSISPIVFENKVNSPELLALFQQFGLNTYLSAEDINIMKDAINELIAQKLEINAQGFLILKNGQLTIYKNPLNNLPANANILQINDVGVGFFADRTFMPFGMYLGGDPTIVGSWNTGVMFTP